MRALLFMNQPIQVFFPPLEPSRSYLLSVLLEDGTEPLGNRQVVIGVEKVSWFL